MAYTFLGVCAFFVLFALVMYVYGLILRRFDGRVKKESKPKPAKQSAPCDVPVPPQPSHGPMQAIVSNDDERLRIAREIWHTRRSPEYNTQAPKDDEESF